MRRIRWRAAPAAVLLALAASVGCAAAANPSDAEAYCAALSARVPTIDAARCRQGLAVGAERSSQGRPLLSVDLPAAAADAPRVLLIGGIHGDELSSIALTFQWLTRINADPERRFHWRVLPVANPDGVLARPSHRTNGRKVDLNRNFPTPGWEANALTYWRERAGGDRRRYPGPGAASETETRWIVAQIEAFKPDAIVSVHAPYNLLDFDGPNEPPTRLGYLRLQPLGVYPGSLGDFAGLHLRLPVITLELPKSAQAPTAAQSVQIWTDLQRWLDRNVTRPAVAAATTRTPPPQTSRD